MNTEAQERAIDLLVRVRMLQAEIAEAINRGNWTHARALTCSMVKLSGLLHREMPHR